MIAAHGFTEEQREPYTFNPAPFIADPRKGMQGYLTSEPFAVEREGGFAPNVFLLADHGYSDYSTTIETMAETVAEPAGRGAAASSTGRSGAGTPTSTATTRPATR